MPNRLSIPKPYRPLALLNLLLFLFVVGGALYLALASRAPGLFACVFARRAHLYCPGCGGSRALYALLRFDLLASLTANPAVLGGILTLGYYEIAFFRAARGRGRARSWPLVAFAVLIVSFFVLRNLLLVLCGIDPLGDQIGYWS